MHYWMHACVSMCSININTTHTLLDICTMHVHKKPCCHSNSSWIYNELSFNMIIHYNSQVPNCSLPWRHPETHVLVCCWNYFTHDFPSLIGFIFNDFIIGPTYDTVPDFWRMIWECDINSIVMLTSIVEGGKVSSLLTFSCAMSEKH